MTTTRNDWTVSAVVLACAAITVFAVARSTGVGSTHVLGLSGPLLCALVALAIQWIAWIPASLQETEHYYDLLGGLTYLAVTALSLWIGSQGEPPSAREWLLSLFAIIWAIRLASFLTRRVRRSGGDGRFDTLKTSAVRFFVPWTLQGIWVTLTLLVVIVVNCQSGTSVPLGVLDVLGAILWCVGFGIEVVADRQKQAFAARQESEGKWIDEGLWARARHPNYFGEILLWSGIAVSGASCFSGAEWFALISPFFVAFLLLKVSGVPMLDERGLRRWGSNPEYIAYRKRTRLLLPL